MSYFTLENEELVLVDSEHLPDELEELYQQIRKKYMIRYTCSDWASDTGDAGMGYDYDNSYDIFREPARREMVIRDGKLVGFYVGFSDDIKLERQATKEYFLKLEKDAKIHCGTSSPRYGNSKTWTLCIKDQAAPLEYVCLFWVREQDKEHVFTPSEFGCDLVEAISHKSKWEDSYGRFDGAFRVTLKLTAEGVKDPDAVLQAMLAYKPILVNA